MLPLNTVDILLEETAQEAFLERFGNDRPQLNGKAIDLAFREGFPSMVPSERMEILEREMERLLGIVSDEEE